MCTKICPVCQNEFFCESEYTESDSALHNYCIMNQISNGNTEERLLRTSTPIAEHENNSNSSFTDSVTDFFYQSWKRGLHSDGLQSDVEGIPTNPPDQLNQQQPYTILQPVCFIPQFVLYNVQCLQQIGYTYDNNFGYIPLYWVWNIN